MRTMLRVVAAFLLLLDAAGGLRAQDPTGKIDRELLSALADTADASAPFFVVLKDRADLTAASRIPDRAARGKAVVQALQATANASQAGLRGFLQGRGVPFGAYWVQNAVFVSKGDLGLAEALAQRPEVAGIYREPVFAIPATQAGSQVTAQGIEWNLSKIRADQAWSRSTGAGIVVSTIDSGARYTHQTLRNQYRGNLGGTFNHNGNWKDPTGVCGAAPCDNTDHGTHVMGTMVGSDGGANQIGVAPGAKWIACKGCANNTACYGSHLMTCAQWVLDPLSNGGSAQPDVVNNSWAGSAGDAWFMDFVDNWRAAGIFPAFASGNKGPSCGTAGSPGDYPDSVSAGSTDINDVISYFSARGPSSFVGTKPNVSAPGASVRSSIATSDTSYTSFSGTSMASPHIAGTVALVWGSQPGLRGQVALTEQLLEDTAVKLPTSENCGGSAGQIPNNTYGSGRIDAFVAVATVPAPNQPPVVSINSPADGATFNCPATVSFAAQASDPETGNLPGISWYEKGLQFGLGTAASKSYACTEAGAHNITASVADNGQLTDTDTIAIQIRACLAKGAACTANSQCCSNRCGGKAGAKACK